MSGVPWFLQNNSDRLCKEIVLLRIKTSNQNSSFPEYNGPSRFLFQPAGFTIQFRILEMHRVVYIHQRGDLEARRLEFRRRNDNE